MEKFTVAGVTLQGFAQGGVQTSVYCPEVRSVFDAGCVLPGVTADRFFITHSHPDHFMALPHIVGKRSTRSAKTPLTVYVPEQILEMVQTVLNTLGTLFGDRNPDSTLEVVGVKPGDSIKIDKEYTAQVLETIHRAPSVGYVIERTTRKIKPEFVGVEGQELGRLRKNGVEITDAKTAPILAVPGDTQIEFLLNQELARKAKILVHEVTVWDEGFNNVEGCRNFGHTHIAEMVEHCEKFEGEALVLCHRSMRYKRAEIEEIAKKRFPAAMLDRIHFFDGGDRV
jgi:ribonuclease Z